MKSYLNSYFDNFKGFSREVWVLTLITYINRTGAMVMPFLTKYLNEGFFFSLQEIGWILPCIGLGSLIGSWLGGKLTDKIGFYTIMLSSLFLTGFGIIALMFLYDFTELCIGLFLITAIADMYKPAMYVAVSNFTDDKNRTRALTLIRLAVNLGIVSGPVIAGLLVQESNYDLLFWIDGITCLIAISAFMLLIDESKMYKARKKIQQRREKEIIKKSTRYDSNFILFLFASFITAFLFFQLFTTIPLYNTQKLKLSELEIGMLLALNGLLIFLFEMPLIGHLEKRKYEATKIILAGSVFMTLGFFCLLISKSITIMALSIFFITLGQILLFSFSNTFAFTRAISGHEGKYMALYTMSFSVAQITSPKVGFSVIVSFSYFSNWLLMGVVGLVGISLYYILDKKIKLETIQKNMS
ncbi:MFS transporter [Flavobacterium amniphilum]|uniref:MDR family MFS transporter n=1 Tax=Flavobacterium amniphilum TaxID=1834035 RepID=UPI00202ABCCC|nr:MFS transporter [Flavobacterium amniphilum]MCL9806465.1 MFS transporter [Flavobacterium amniphilum]